LALKWLGKSRSMYSVSLLYSSLLQTPQTISLPYPGQGRARASHKCLTWDICDMWFVLATGWC
jgi:hypothetical protein